MKRSLSLIALALVSVVGCTAADISTAITVTSTALANYDQLVSIYQAIVGAATVATGS